VDIHLSNQIGKSKEDFFELALKRMSIQAFNVLLNCGVRDLAGLLHLTAEDLQKAAISPQITTELMRIQFQFNEYMTNSDQINNNNDQDGTIDQTIPGQQQETYEEADSSAVDLQPYTPIPNDLMKNLSTRARNVLLRENILTCERLLKLHDEELFGIVGIGKKTVFDIKRLQDKVDPHNTNFSRVSVKTVQHEKPKRQNIPCYNSQVICPPKGYDHWPSDPADWSLLSQTLPEIFQISLSSCYLSNGNEKITISSIEIPVVDIDHLRKIWLFPEDPIDFLFSMTTGYILQSSISDNTLSIILDYLSQFSGITDNLKMFISTANVSNTAIYADIQTNLYEEFRVPEFSSPNLITKNEDRNAILIWRDIAKTTERCIIDRLGFTIKGLKTIKHLWQLKEQAINIENTILKGLPAEVYCGFEQLTDAFVKAIVKNKREYMVLKGRLGLDGRKWTLEELGHRENLTRERIRQIEKKLMPILKKPKTLDKLSFLWLVIDEILAIGGGVCCVSEITESLKNRWKWEVLPSDEALASLISLSANYELVWDYPIRIIMPNHMCVTCKEIGSKVTRSLDSQANGTLSFEKATAIMNEFCQRQPCKMLCKIHKFSNGYFHFLDDAIEDILADDTTLYTRFAWGLKYGMRRIDLVEKIITMAGRAMHFKEVHAEVNKNRPIHAQLSEGSIYGNLDRSPLLLLWGPGTFIHKELIKIPRSLISEIENDIIQRLILNNINFLLITGIFEEYQPLLLANNIPNTHALYSCLRISNNQEIDCPDYPYILRRESEGQRLAVPLVLEEFVLKQEGVVTLDQIKRYAIEKLCANEAVFTASYLPKIPNLLRINRGEFIHLRTLGIEKNQLIPIIDHLNKLLENYDHVSAKKIFNDKKITCKLLGISSPMLLFSLIQLYYFHQFDLLRYPQIRLSGVTTDKNQTSGVALEVIKFIREMTLPCNLAELYQYFVNELGYKKNSIFWAFHTDKSILCYSTGVIVHFETLGWTEDKQAALEMLAVSHLSNRNIAGKPFGLISYLYQYMHDQLPELPDQISWTATLFRELLSRSEKLRIIGSQRNAFVLIPNAKGIESLDDLLYYILDSGYDGAANIDQFISDMREAGILKKSLTSIMLGVDSRVVIDGNVIKLARLSDRVERS